MTSTEPCVRLTDDEWFVLVSVNDGLKLLVMLGPDSEEVTYANAVAHYVGRLDSAIQEIRERLTQEGICPKRPARPGGPIWTD